MTTESSRSKKFSPKFPARMKRQRLAKAAARALKNMPCRHTTLQYLLDAETCGEKSNQA